MMAHTPGPWPAGCYRPDECRVSGFCEYDRCPHGAELVLPETLKQTTEPPRTLALSDIDNETYIGNGVYASFDGYNIWLRARTNKRDNTVKLAPPVLAALTDYGRRIWAPPAAEDAPE